MSAILSALKSGYAPQKILDFLKKNFPVLNTPIAKAAATGYSADKILSFLYNNSKDADTKGLSPHEIEAMRTKRYDRQFKKTAALAAGGAYSALRQGAGGLAQAASGSVPTPGNPPPTSPTALNTGGQTPAPGPQPMANAPVQPQSPTKPNIAAASQAPPPVQPLSPEGESRKQVIEKFAAMSPEFREYANDQIAKGLDKPTDQMLRDFNKLKNSQKKEPGFMESFVKDTNEMVRGDRQQEQPRPLEKGTPVATASGIVGNVKSIRNKEALVEDDNGKLHKIKAEEADPIPEELQQKDFGSIAKDYLSRFPQHGKESLSTAISLITRNPDTDEVYVVFPDSPGSMYIYKNVEPELYEQILSANTAPKTSGGNSITGSWDVNIADSRGAPFHEIRRNKDKYPFTKVDIGYNMLQRMMEAIKQLRKDEAVRERKKPK